jgi:hypothetical protein
MQLRVTSTFARAVKKRHPRQKADLDSAVRAVASDPGIGEPKVGGLAGIQVYKFRMANPLCLVAYRVLDDDVVKLLMVGPHENVFRDLKRVDD